MSKAYYDIGEIPPLGEVPQEMFAQTIRQERFGEPVEAMRIERVRVPELRSKEVLVYVMAAGINYNGIWASRGYPVDVVALHAKRGEDVGFHIGGSDAAGVVYAVGEGVDAWKVGDHVVLHGGVWDHSDPFVQAGGDPMLSSGTKMWGYEVNYGGFAQFCRVQDHQCMAKAPHLTWEQAAASCVGGATAYRMLNGWPPHDVKPGDVVLIWGGAGGLGAIAIQITRLQGGIPIAVVSSPEREAFCLKLGAAGCINRRAFQHWGILPHWEREPDAYKQWTQQARLFGRAIWDILGEKKNPRIVFEHSGEATFPTSLFVCDLGGMVVLCGGTSGYYAVADLRYTWMRQKRIQGSHYANDHQCYAYNQLLLDQKIDPCLSQTVSFEEIPQAHQMMARNEHPPGNVSALVGAPQAGWTDFPG